MSSPSPRPDVLVYIVCHDDASFEEATRLKETMYPFGVPLRFPNPSKLFENQVFVYMNENRDEWQDKAYVGVCPYSWLKKTSLKINLLEMITKDKGRTDVFSMLSLLFIKRKFNTQMSFVEAVTHQHGPFMLSALLQILRAYGGYSDYQILDKSIEGFFLNHWVAKTSWMKRYVDFFAFALAMAERPHMAAFLNEQSWYTGELLKKPDVLLYMSGKPYYTMHAFLFERLPAFFFHLEGAVVNNIGGYSKYEFAD